MTQPKLYQYEACPFCWKVRAILSYKRIPYSVIEVHPLNKKEIQFSEDYKKVPILLDKDGQRIIDSTQIMRHIDKQYAERPVFETDPAKREEEEQWLAWSDATLVRALPPLIYRTLPEAIRSFSYITRVGHFSFFQRCMVKYVGAFVMRMVAKKKAKEQGIKDPRKHVKQCLSEWEGALGKKTFFGGERLNGADLAVFGILRSVEGLSAFELIRENEKVHDWYQRASDEVALASHRLTEEG